jgi:hypothetical protein
MGRGSGLPHLSLLSIPSTPKTAYDVTSVQLQAWQRKRSFQEAQAVARMS